MSVLLRDSFDTYTTVSQRNNSVAGSPTIGAFGRNGTNGLRINAPTGATWAQKPFPAVGTALVHVAFNPQSLSFATTHLLIALLDNGTAQVDLRVTPSGKLRFTRNGTQIGSDSTNSLAAAVYVHIIIKVVIHNSAGSIECRVNGVSTGWIPSTGSLDTQNSANATVDAARLDVTSADANVDFRFDDLVILDTAGSVNNDFLGDVRVEGGVVNADGSPVDWTALSGSDVSNVDENPPDEATTYHHPATAGPINVVSQG